MVEKQNKIGVLYSYTTFYEPAYAPEQFRVQVPYVLALVDTESVGMVTAMLTDIDWHKEIRIISGEEKEVDIPDVEIGMPLEMVTRKLSEDGKSGVIAYGYKFRPPILQA